MNRLSLIALCILSFSLAACDDDSNQKDIRHYYHPVWSPDGSLIIAAFEQSFGDPSAPRAAISQLAIHHAVTGAETIITLNPGLDYKRYHVVPGNSAIAVMDENMDFFSLEGAHLGSYTVSLLNTVPSAAVFSTTEKSFLWAAYKDGMIHVGKATYTDNPWTPVNETVLQSFQGNSRPVDLIFAGEGYFLIALEEGRILHYPLHGNKLGEHLFKPDPSSNPWKRRISYIFKAGENIEYLYTLNDSGLYQINLTAREGKLIVNGQAKYLTGYDVADSTLGMFFEVSSGDIWWAKLDGYPLSRILPGHRMGMFSPNGRDIASVALARGEVDSLSVFRLYR